MEHYIETLRTEELTTEVEERHRKEKMNILELDFLKNLQHMIGETEDPLFVVKNAYTLLRNFIEFDFFGTMLLNENEASIQIFPGIEKDPELLRDMASVLVRKIPVEDGGETAGHRIVLQGVAQEGSYPDNVDVESVVVELSTADHDYGYAALYRRHAFDWQEESIFNRFCSHITVTLEKIHLFNEIKVLSIHDGLTGIHNHMYIVGKLESEVERSKRYGTSFSVVLFDIDDFKMINDVYGHLAGDCVLKRITQIMKENLRTIDRLGRYGGEEFLIILPETDPGKAFIVAERLRSSIEDEVIDFDNNLIRTTVSGGVASYAPGREAKGIIKIADDNLYHAKKDGKNRIYYG